MNKKQYIIPQLDVVRLDGSILLTGTSTISGDTDKDQDENPTTDGGGVINGSGEWEF